MIRYGSPYGPHFHPYSFWENQLAARSYSFQYPQPHYFPHLLPPVYPYGGYHSYPPPNPYYRMPCWWPPVQPQPFEQSRMEPTPQGFSVKIDPSQGSKEDEVSSAKGFGLETGVDIGGKHGVGFHADGHVGMDGIHAEADSHLGAEQYGVSLHGEAGANVNKGINFETGTQIGGKYGLDAHAEGHLGFSEGVGLATEAQFGGDHGIGAHLAGQLGGKQGAVISTGAQIGGDHGLGTHAKAHVGGGQGVGFKIGGNIGNFEKQIGIHIGGKNKEGMVVKEDTNDNEESKQA